MLPSCYVVNYSPICSQTQLVQSLNAQFSHSWAVSDALFTNRLNQLFLIVRKCAYTAPALWNSLKPDLRHKSSHSTSSQPNLNSPVFSFSPSVFLKKLKTFLFLLNSVTAIYLCTDILGNDLALLLHLIVISPSFILMSFTALLCYLTW
jgi:hypothetical protein